MHALQAKFLHFEKIDVGRLKDMWGLQQEEATALVHQLLAADRIIHEQQLGLGWQVGSPQGTSYHTPGCTRGLPSSPRRQGGGSSGRRCQRFHGSDPPAPPTPAAGA